MHWYGTGQYAASQLGPTTRFRLGFDVHSHSKVFFSANTGRARLNAIQAALVARLAQHHNAVAGKLYQDVPDPAVQGIGTADEYFASTWLVPSYSIARGSSWSRWVRVVARARSS